MKKGDNVTWNWKKEQHANPEDSNGQRLANKVPKQVTKMKRLTEFKKGKEKNQPK